MSSGFNNKRLLFLLVGLIAILFLTIVIKIPKEKATLKSNIIQVDTSEVNRIMLYPRISNGNTIEFNRDKSKWTVQQGGILSATQEGAVQSIFRDILSIKPQSLAARDKSKWKEFELTDSLATRIKFLNKKGKVLADLMIGKMSYKQPDNPYAGYGGNNIQVTTYVRLFNEQEVYAADGLISFSFNVKFDDWRDKTFVKCKKEDITKISFIYPADSSYNLTKKDKIWQINSQNADSTKVSEYLISLGYLNGENFRDNFKPTLSPVFQWQIEGNNLLNFSVKCFKGDGVDEYILNSSLNPDVYFTTPKNGLFEKLFKPGSYFLKRATKH